MQPPYEDGTASIMTIREEPGGDGEFHEVPFWFDPLCPEVPHSTS
ncbi:hypothetical protein SAMN05216223_13113 [Actinacidiphila yanglinensis]|uniref:Uncharacterized protein n=1 Tax=Actinacidiphila yanglinensis TaxID=310779 RepID=A0A1H6EBV7_9ACTN|nr:hypothetical protein SAMN05216223_13113 [Actinacidiphila yanglinensis]